MDESYRDARHVAAAALTWITADGGRPAMLSLIARHGYEDTLDLIRNQDPQIPLEWRGMWAHRVENLPAYDLTDLSEQQIHLLLPSDREYPGGLQALGDNRPIGLWVHGSDDGIKNLFRHGNYSITITGARAAGNASIRTAQDFAFTLAPTATIVSTGSFGVDIAANMATATGKHANTIIVQPGGIDRSYPESHAAYFREILDKGGLLVSEYPPGTVPAAARILDRNRLVAALSDATIVIAAAHRSGAINIANQAAELHKPVGAIPGAIDSPFHAGTNELIHSGQATIVVSPDDARRMLADREREFDSRLTQPWAEFITDVILDNLDDQIGSHTYGSDLAGDLCSGISADGTYFYSTYKTEEFLKNHWADAGDFYSYLQSEYGQVANPFDEPESFLVAMIEWGVSDRLSQLESLTHTWDQEIEITPDLAGKIRDELTHESGLISKWNQLLDSEFHGTSNDLTGLDLIDLRESLTNRDIRDALIAIALNPGISAIPTNHADLLAAMNAAASHKPDMGHVAALEQALDQLNINPLSKDSLPLHEIKTYISWWTEDIAHATEHMEAIHNLGMSSSLAELTAYAIKVNLPAPWKDPDNDRTLAAPQQTITHSDQPQPKTSHRR